MTLLKKGRTYRNRLLSEVDMHILSIEDVTDLGIDLDVVWVRRGTKMLARGPDKILVKREQLGDWKEL